MKPFIVTAAYTEEGGLTLNINGTEVAGNLGSLALFCNGAGHKPGYRLEFAHEYTTAADAKKDGQTAPMENLGRYL